MATGPIIKKFRNIRGMTQVELGEKTGLNDVRVRHYELDIRTPKDDIANKIAGALKIHPEYLYDGDYPYTIEGVMRLLFKIDDDFELKIDKINVEPEGNVSYTKERYALYFEGLARSETLNDLIAMWFEKKYQYDNEEITLEEYQDWKANFPGSTSKDYKPTTMNKKKNYKYHFEEE